MSDNQSNNKRIAKNTLALYFRMLVSMLVSLYTSRITLEVLGVTDFGIYNVVGGIVVLFTFLNGTMATATQRFLSFDIGKGDEASLSHTFSMTFWIHVILALLVALVAEIGGLWLLYNEMTIPEERLNAAFWVFQLSLLSTILSITQVPYNAAIVAHERMSIYAYFSILDVVLKLLLVILLQWINADKLVLYAVLLFCVSITMLSVNRIYCIRNFKESKISLIWDADKFRQIFSFAGWNLSAQIADVGRTQGVNIILNIFSGPALNAARGIAVTVNGTITQFVNNFMTALNPQIVKYYAQDEKQKMFVLIRRACKFSSFLLLMLTLPVMFQTEFVLRVWLKTPPEYAVIFCRLILLAAILNTFSSTVFFGTMASGKIKEYQTCMSIMILTVPLLTYFGYKLGLPPYSCVYPDILVNALAIFMRPILTKRVTGFPLLPYFRESLLPVLLVIFVTLPLPIYLNSIMHDGIMKFFVVSVTTEVILMGAILTIGLSKNERYVIINNVKSRILHK